jgi:hypothetical protein
MVLSRGVLGVHPVDAGRYYSIRPSLGSLRWMEGSMPTRFGPIRVRAEADGATLRQRIELPEGVSASLADGREVEGPGSFTL